MNIILRSTVLITGALMFSVLVLAQEVNELGTVGPETVMKGPFGQPLMVMDEVGSFQYPIKVYSDASVEEYVPDITSDGWIAWHAEDFRQRGSYNVMLYTYSRASHRTSRQLISVDTRKHVAIVRDGIWGKSSQMSLEAGPARLTKAIAQTSRIITDEIRSYSGLTIQQALQADRAMAARMAMGATSGQMRASPASPDPSTSMQPQDAPGVYHLGGDIKPPVVIRTVDPEFSDEDRKKKVGGTVRVHLVIDERGNPTDVQVSRGVDPGLDEKAVDAVRQYQFKPATKSGIAVKVDLYVDVNFQIF